MNYLIRLSTETHSAIPQERAPVVGHWYCGMETPSPSSADFGCELSGELMRYDGEGCWTNEDEDPDGREPNPSNYDYLQEQVGHRVAA